MVIMSVAQVVLALARPRVFMTAPQLSDIAPSSISIAEATEDELAGPLPDLRPPEHLFLPRGAIFGRRTSYHWGRTLARRAMTDLGHSAAPIPAGLAGEPVWPTALVGSITHCASYCAAVVAEQVTWLSVGVDAEVIAPVGLEVIEQIASPRERAWIAASEDSNQAAIALFSAKEAVYKAWFPLMRSWLAFDDVSLVFDDPTSILREETKVSTRRLVATLSSPIRAEAIHIPELVGHVVYDSTLVITLVALPRP